MTRIQKQIADLQRELDIVVRTQDAAFESFTADLLRLATILKPYGLKIESTDNTMVDKGNIDPDRTIFRAWVTFDASSVTETQVYNISKKFYGKEKVRLIRRDSKGIATVALSYGYSIEALLA